MTDMKKQGMRLRRTEAPRERNTGALLQTMICLLSSMALNFLMARLTGFGDSWVMAVMLAACTVLVLIRGLLLCFGKRQWFCCGVLAVMLILAAAFRVQILEGFRLFWNQAGGVIVGGTGMVLPEWQPQLPDSQHPLCLALFGILLSWGVALICCLLSSVPGLLALALPAAAFTGMEIFGQSLPFGCLALVLTASVLILMCGGWRGKGAMASVLLSWALGAAAAALLLLAASMPGMQAWTAGIGQTVRQHIHTARYETAHTTLPEGDFRTYRAEENGVEAALIVTMEAPEKMYLRGFTGSVFENDTWKPLEKDILAENKDLLYWLGLNAFHPSAQFQAASAGLELPRNSVTVQNTGACSRYLYAPFHVSGGAYLASEDLNTEGILTDGQRVCTYSTVGSAQSIPSVLEYLQTTDDPAVLQYRKAESAYRQFVYSFYLQVPEEARELLAKRWDEIASGYSGVDALTAQQAQECALRFLSQCFPEDGTREDLALPLDAAKGTSYQYATVAALTLRYLGIPARYAEGYLITDDMASAAEPGDPVSVDSSCARAWVEIYQDGIGWIPMELTPGLGEMIREDTADQGDGDSVDEELDPEEAEEELPTESRSESPDASGGTVVRLLRIMGTGLVWLLPVLVVIVLILWLRGRILRGRREKRYRDENVREAVARIFADTVSILEILGLDRGNGSMRALTTPAAEQFGPEYGALLKEMIGLNDRAMFSSRPLEEGHRETALRFRARTLEALKAETTWYRRLWLKWVRCLY